MPGRMLDHLGPAARAAREQAGLRQIDIATAAGVAHTAISRFELGDNWPLDVDRIIDAYAEEVGVEPRAIWETALLRWQRTRNEADLDDSEGPGA